MERETEHEENDGVLSAAASSEEVPADMVASDHDEDNFEGPREAPVEEEAPCEPEENRGNNDYIKKSGLDVKKNDLPISHEESIVFQINSIDDDGPPRLHLDTLGGRNASPTQEEDVEEEEAEEEEAEEDKSTAAPADQEAVHLLQEQCDRDGALQPCDRDGALQQCDRDGALQQCDRDGALQQCDRDGALQQCRLLQMKLTVFFRKKAGDSAQLDRAVPVPEQLQQYEKYMSILTELKQQLAADCEAAQQQAEGQRLHSREKLDTVEDEWRALAAQKQEVAVAALSRRLGRHAAQAKVEATIATETLLQHELIKQRLKHIKLRIRIHRLEAELRKEEEHARDPRHRQFEQLQVERLELKKHTERQHEESSKMQKSISSSLELLSNVKEKLFWSQMEVQTQREQLAVVEAMVARKRDLLTRTRQARNGLLRDNLRLKEHRGLLGNRVLLQDFEDTVDASDHLEEQLEDLKRRRAGVVFSCGRWKKKLETTS